MVIWLTPIPPQLSTWLMNDPSKHTHHRYHTINTFFNTSFRKLERGLCGFWNFGKRKKNIINRTDSNEIEQKIQFPIGIALLRGYTIGQNFSLYLGVVANF